MLRNFPFFWVPLTLLMYSLGFSASALSQSRMTALVVGNADYSNVGKLPNPVRDLILMQEIFKNADARVTSVRDTNVKIFYRELRNATQLFSTDPSSVLIVYVAGHGVQIYGKNYLVPTDAKLWRTEADALREGIDLSAMIDELASMNSGTLIFLFDICRNNPFEGELAGAGRGIAAMPVRKVRIKKAPIKTEARAGSQIKAQGHIYIMFSTQPGEVALDGPPESNSPFAAALAKLLFTSERPLPEKLLSVREQVQAVTGGVQVPWYDTNIGAP